MLFRPDGFGAPLFFAQWRDRLPRVALQTGAQLVEQDGSATNYLRSTWRAAFPDRSPLPFERVANKDGTGTDLFWQVFA